MLGENLQNLRKMRRLSQEQAAEAAGVSRQAYAKWESGETSPDIYNCIARADFYDVSLDDMVRDSVSAFGLPVPPKGKHLFGMVSVGEKGQIVIPKRARDVFAIRAGDRLMVLGDEEQGLALVKEDVMLQFMKAVKDAAHEPGER